MPTDDDADDNPPIPLFPRSLGPARRRIYQRNPKHGPYARGTISREPTNGQDALDWSVRAKPSSPVRIGIDYEDESFVVLHRHREVPPRAWDETFHGFVVPWPALEQQHKNALMNAGMADHRGRIL
jgi:hypothetical protein